MKYGFAFTVVAISGCAVVNNVKTLAPPTSVVKYSSTEGYEDRFSNLYSKVKAYPVTCEENCYPNNADIECGSYMQDCTYRGVKSDANLNTGFTVQWLGHASFVITTKSHEQLLFDPVFEQFDWPVDVAFKLSQGFYRNLPEQLSEQTLSSTDAIMYSHIHYDHFNKSDISDIGNTPEYLVPLGFAEHFPESGFNITEMAWYSNTSIGDTKVHFVPAHHFSNRIWVPFLYEDDNASLWGGWIIENNGHTLFFAGDTGYSPHFKDIGERFGTIDICLLPIASYFSEESPGWYRNVHTTPEDAIVAAEDLNCRIAIPWGYGNASWRMGDKTSHSALFRFLHMKNELKSSIPWYIMNEGETVKL